MNRRSGNGPLPRTTLLAVCGETEFVSSSGKIVRAGGRSAGCERMPGRTGSWRRRRRGGDHGKSHRLLEAISESTVGAAVSDRVLTVALIGLRTSGVTTKAACG